MIKVSKPPKRVLADPTLRRTWIIQTFADSGSSLPALARRIGVSKSTIYSVVDRPYPKMERILAAELGMTAQELFPERYGRDGLPNRPMGRPTMSVNKNKRKATARRRLKAGAA